MALSNMGIKVRHVFSSDIDPVVKNFIKDNFEPEVFFDDIRDRNNRDLQKNMDLYVAGFPCQPFSIAGHQQGLDDERGKIIHSVLHHIKPPSSLYGPTTHHCNLFSLAPIIYNVNKFQTSQPVWRETTNTFIFCTLQEHYTCPSFTCRLSGILFDRCDSHIVVATLSFWSTTAPAGGKSHARAEVDENEVHDTFLVWTSSACINSSTTTLFGLGITCCARRILGYLALSITTWLHGVLPWDMTDMRVSYDVDVTHMP